MIGSDSRGRVQGVISLKTPEEIKVLHEGGKRLSAILRALEKETKVGVSTADLNALAEKLIQEGGDKPAFLGYTAEGSKRAYPAAVCISVNDIVVHGIPNENPIILKSGDIVTLDLGLVHGGLFTDSAITVQIGKTDPQGKELVRSTREALLRGIKAAVLGGRIGDIGYAIESYVKKTPFFLAEQLAGHGVGYMVHEDPYVPNTGRKGQGEKLVSGMVLAIEPMLCEGSGKVFFEKDDYTVRTRDGGRAAHFEHTIAITENGVIVLTK